MTPAPLVVWASATPPTADDGTRVYCWDGYDVPAGTQSLLAYVDLHADRVRRAYLDWIAAVGGHRVGGRTVIEQLAMPDGLSYWWMTRLVEQSPWKSPRMLDALRLIALGDLAAREPVHAVHLVGGDAAIHESISAWCVTRGIAYRWTPPPAVRRRGWRSLYKRLPAALQSGVTLIKHCWPRRLFRQATGSWSSDPRAVFFCSYLFHVQQAAGERGEFASGYWTSLPAMLHAEGRPTNWLEHYEPSRELPNPERAATWLQRFAQDPAQQGYHRILESFLSLRVLLRTVQGLWWLRGRARVLHNVGAGIPWASSPSPWPLLRSEWEASLTGPAAAMNCLWLALFDDAMRTLPTQRHGLYLMENQSWERAMIHAWRRHGHGTLVAVQHSTVRFWDLRYAVAPGSWEDGPYPCPQPDRVAANGAAAMAALPEMGMRVEQLVPVEALRYASLEALAASRPREAQTPRRVLVLTDYHAEGTAHVMGLVCAAAAQLGSAVVWTVKAHPNLPISPNDFPEVPLAIAVGPLATLLGDYDIAITSNHTSAAVDAYVSGMPVIITLDPDAVNFSPLRGHAGVAFVGTADDLVAALRQVSPDDIDQEAARAYFALDATLPRWRALLDVPAQPVRRP